MTESHQLTQAKGYNFSNKYVLLKQISFQKLLNVPWYPFSPFMVNLLDIYMPAEIKTTVSIFCTLLCCWIWPCI